MPSANSGNYRYSRNDDEVMAMVAAEIGRLTAADEKGRAPSRVLWDVRRDKAAPCSSYLISRFGLSWTQIVRLAGYEIKRKVPVRRDLDSLTTAETLAQHVAAGARPASWMDKFEVAINVLPHPTRTETVRGMVDGRPCIIRREYWMVR
jgi:hypothetical protein